MFNLFVTLWLLVVPGEPMFDIDPMIGEKTQNCGAGGGTDDCKDG